MKFKKTDKKDVEALRTIAEFAVEEYRFMRTYVSAVNKLFPEEQKRYASAYTYHESKVRELLEKFNLKAVFFDGQDYDEGLPVTPLNADEFNISDPLIVGQTFEPAIITSEGNIIRQGTIILARKENHEENNTSEDEE